MIAESGIFIPNLTHLGESARDGASGAMDAWSPDGDFKTAAIARPCCGPQ
jgi:hypothetical protein